MHLSEAPWVLHPQRDGLQRGETVSPGLGQGWSGTQRGGRTPAVPFVTRELQVEERDLCAWDIFSGEEGEGLPEGNPQQSGKSVCGEARGNSGK